MKDSKAARSAQIANARVELAKLDESIAKENAKRATAGTKVKRLEAAAKISSLKNERARQNRIIKDKAFARNN
jgi:hypothetical protein